MKGGIWVPELSATARSQTISTRFLVTDRHPASKCRRLSTKQHCKKSYKHSCHLDPSIRRKAATPAPRLPSENPVLSHGCFQHRQFLLSRAPRIKQFVLGSWFITEKNPSLAKPEGLLQGWMHLSPSRAVIWFHHPVPPRCGNKS